jgi:hypothetical protein
MAHRSQRRALVVPPQPALAYPRRPRVDLADITATAAALVGEAARARIALDVVARWCAEVGGVDPRLELAALRHATEVIAIDLLAADVVLALRLRLAAAGELFPTLVAHGGIPRVLATLGLDDVDPPDGALHRALAPRIARFYWQRLRAFVAWRAACRWPP